MNINQQLLRHLNHGPLEASAGDDGKLVVRVSFPTDEHGYTERGCSATDCEPKLFKIRGSLPTDRDRRCPYCGRLGNGNSFATPDQTRYAREKVGREARAAMSEAVHRMVTDVLGLDSQGRRRLGSGMFSMELSLTQQKAVRAEVAPPTFERPRRDVRCSKCGIEHIVFGLATWCHSCGADIFDAHVAAELGDITKTLRDAIVRRSDIGERQFFRQAENVLEDLVSAWEGAFRHLLSRRLLAQGKTRAEVDAFIQKEVRNALQGLDRSATLIRDHLQVDLSASVDATDLARAEKLFAARHAIAHCLGVTDRKLVARSGTGHVGRELELDPTDLQWLADFVETRVRAVWSSAFPTGVEEEKS